MSIWAMIATVTLIVPAVASLAWSALSDQSLIWSMVEVAAFLAGLVSMGWMLFMLRRDQNGDSEDQS